MKEAVGQRRKDIDMIKGISIFLMVFNHVWFGNKCHHLIQSFHMPLFFIVSGYLWTYSDPSILFRAKRKAKALLVPYFTFASAFVIIYIIESAGDKATATGAILKEFLFVTDLIPHGGALWFLPCMYLTDLLFSFIEVNIISKHQRFFLIILISVIGAAYSSANLPILPWAIEPMMTAVLFMGMGNLIRKHEDRLFSLQPIGIVLIFMLGVVLSILNPTIDMRSARYCIVPLYFIDALLITFSLWYFAKIIDAKESRLSNVINKTLSRLAIDGMSFLCLNGIIIEYLNKVFCKLLDASLEVRLATKVAILVITLIVCYAFALIISKTRLSWILGKKQQYQ